MICSRVMPSIVVGLLMGIALPGSPVWAAECAGTTSDGVSYEGKIFEGEVRGNEESVPVLADLRTKKKEKLRRLTVRQGGDAIGFGVHPGASVSGLTTDVSKLKKGDWVRVCGPQSALAAPRWAYSIEVIEEPDRGVVEE